MDDVPLPKVDYDAGWHRQYTADQMHAHAAAVSAAKDAEIAQLRAELIKSLADNAALRADAIDRQNNVVAPLRERVRVLEDALRAMLTHMGMDEDEWNKPTFDQARAALEQKP